MIANGNFKEKLLNHYAEGQTVSFTCNSDYIEDPSDGLVECGKEGWNKVPSCRLGEAVIFYYTHFCQV